MNRSSHCHHNPDINLKVQLKVIFWHFSSFPIFYYLVHFPPKDLQRSTNCDFSSNKKLCNESCCKDVCLNILAMNIFKTNNISFVSRGLRVVYLIIRGSGYPIFFFVLLGYYERRIWI
jgi:hypothetical protein